MQSAGRGGVERPSPAFLRGTLGGMPDRRALTIEERIARIERALADLHVGLAPWSDAIADIAAEFESKGRKHPSLRPGE
jgi:hypothetical protein